MRKAYLYDLQMRKLAQTGNLKACIKYAKDLTQGLEEYKSKVDMAENVADDIRQSGNDDISSLLDMMNRYKRRHRTLQEEITKFTELMLVKDQEIISITADLSSIKEYRENAYE